MHHYLDAWKNYVEFSGRATRTQFWMFNLFHYLVLIVLVFASVLTGGAGAYDAQDPGMDLFGLIYSLYGLAVFLPSLALTVRRLHDTGRSGFWYFIGFIPLLGGLALLAFTLMGSEEGDNRYGPASTVDPAVFE
jgi:uncharacterized membrane protein YhaH (DUF805 family)